MTQERKDIFSGGSAIITTTQETNFEAAYSHVTNNGSDHSFIDQNVTTAASPTFDNITTTGFKQGSVTTDITATGTTQGTAISLTTEINQVTTVTASSDGVKLPPAAPGRRVYIRNDDASSPPTTLTVYSDDVASPSDTINGGSSITVAADSSQWVVALDETTWVTE